MSTNYDRVTVKNPWRRREEDSDMERHSKLGTPFVDTRPKLLFHRVTGPFLRLNPYYRRDDGLSPLRGSETGVDIFPLRGNIE